VKDKQEKIDVKPALRELSLIGMTVGELTHDNLLEDIAFIIYSAHNAFGKLGGSQQQLAELLRDLQ